MPFGTGLKRFEAGAVNPKILAYPPVFLRFFPSLAITSFVTS